MGDKIYINLYSTIEFMLTKHWYTKTHHQNTYKWLFIDPVIELPTPLPAPLSTLLSHSLPLFFFFRNSFPPFFLNDCDFPVAANDSSLAIVASLASRRIFSCSISSCLSISDA